MRHQRRSAIKNWFRDNFHALKDDKSAADDLKEFLEICGDKQPHIYIYESCRIAVAHAGKDSKSDPDDAHEIVRLYIAADIMWRLARHLISAEFRISDDPWSGD